MVRKAPRDRIVSNPTVPNPFEDENISLIVGIALTFVAFLLRFYKLNHPDQVVFDEVHFGKFAAYYITREYYFDVHPPLAKMLLGAAGWFVGFDGKFDFEKIGDSYTQHHVPYVGMRALPAILGSLTVPIVYGIMRQTGFPIAIAAFSASLIVFDNAHITQTRLILLDAALVFFMALSLYAYIRFRKLRYSEYTTEWWLWLCSTGFFLACTLGCKMVGLFTFLTIGTAVLVDLWNILDYKKGLSMEQVWRHFFARALGLILLPFIVYLSFFWIHFKILKYSGTGDSFMSPAFQETLHGNELLLNSQEIRYYDTLTIKHRESKVFLHSHLERYPLRYDDGRISSQGQQVTGYPHNDTNNHWQVIPTKALPETGRGRVVRHNDIVQLLHVVTQSNLLTHDVASPLTPTNQEFTTFPRDDHSRYNDTLFQIVITDAHDGQAWKSKSALWTHSEPLPEWAFGQQEINGNKNAQERSATWYVDQIVEDETGEDLRNRTGVVEPKQVKSMSFFRKFGELQLLMLQHNAGLTASHPYASNPINWPFLLNGISFWTSNGEKQQIYLIGNPLGWWICVMGLSVFVGIVGADLMARRRNIKPIQKVIIPELRNRLLNSTGFFVSAWAFHYFPFYLMSRQLFVHHYLPAHLASTLVAGSVLNFVLTESIEYPISVARRGVTHLRPRMYTDFGIKGLAISAAVLVILVISFCFFAPLSYGTPGLSGEEVNRRRIISSWTLHFQSKEIDTTCVHKI
ncbi:glycosyltransferase family 39 protein [Hydnum rufescens UP504]|uniref:Dolichyl-phosphate-mannose--protein mannosyltransferase n=1 Tax=Hydnum rufescens UP504 TaxID=1448309 RepID=A0A9P6AXN4_9AGAM|nr:glycosyltransferase family 39 protein [Hydnum rufescens UP504]